MHEACIDPAVIMHQLSRILASTQFRSAGRLRDFLSFIVLETIAGHEQSIKEYTIGTQVYGRRELFNPKLDSIVRVEAVKLRTRLEMYYSQPGSDQELAISVPKGGYVPVFRNSVATADHSHSSTDRVSELCDLGSLALFRRTPAAIAASTQCFALARNLNPADARTHVGLADAYVASLDVEIAPPSNVLGDLAQSVAQGRRLNQRSAYAQVFASIYSTTSHGIGTEAVQDARRALELEPGSAMAHFWGAGLLSAQGVHEAGIEHMREASRNAPFCSLFRAYLGRVLYYAGRNQEALSVLRDVNNADPTLAVSHMWTAQVYSELGQHDEAVHAGLHSIELSETSATVSGVAYVFARSGRREAAEHILDRLNTEPPYGYVSPLQLAIVAEGLNRPAEAALHLNNAHLENAWGLIWHKVDPRIMRIHANR